MYEKEISPKEQQELVRRAKECDPSAFARIYEHYYQDIYNFIYYRVSSAHVAEDLASEVFLKALEAIDSYTFRGIPLSVWLFRIARNTVFLYYRDHTTPVDLEEELLPTEVGPGDVFETRLTQKQLAQALSTLTEDQQQVLILKFVDGFTNTDIAQIMGKSEGSVKSLQHRALGRLSNIWQEISPEENQDLMGLGGD
jgi:RNA polymerase sigma-70 factor (ECF subfamily)